MAFECVLQSGPEFTKNFLNLRILLQSLICINCYSRPDRSSARPPTFPLVRSSFFLSKREICHRTKLRKFNLFLKEAGRGSWRCRAEVIIRKVMSPFLCSPRKMRMRSPLSATVIRKTHKNSSYGTIISSNMSAHFQTSSDQLEALTGSIRAGLFSEFPLRELI